MQAEFCYVRCYLCQILRVNSIILKIIFFSFFNELVKIMFRVICKILLYNVTKIIS